MTPAMREAVRWLQLHNGEGCFTKMERSQLGGTVLAAGELAPVSCLTWERLERLGLVERYGPKRQATGQPGRIRLTRAGLEFKRA
jgi:hypothetical protein